MCKIIERKIWSHSCMIHFAMELCAKLVETIRPDGWLLLIKHSILNILWFTAIIQANYEVFCWKRWENRRRMSRECAIFSIEIECNEMMIVFVALLGKLWFIPQSSRKKLVVNWEKLRSHWAINRGKNSVDKIKINTQNAWRIYVDNRKWHSI